MIFDRNVQLKWVYLLLLPSIIDSSHATCPMNPNPPTNAVCGLRGSIQSPLAPNSGEVPNLQRCIEFLTNGYNPKEPVHGHDRPGSSVPRLISFNTTSNICAIYDRTASQNKFVEAKHSDTKFYDGSCFDCPFDCPLPPGGNRLLNGGFQLSSKNALPWGNNAELRSPGFNSSQCYFTDIANQQYNFAVLGQVWRACPGQFYSMTFDIMPLDSDPPISCDGYYYPGEDCKTPLAITVDSIEIGYLRTPYAVPNNTWGSPYFTFQYTNDANIEPFFGLLFERDAYVDNVAITPVAAPAPAPGAQELLQNPGFESGNFTPWVMASGDGEMIVSPGLKQSSYAVQFANGYNGYVLYQIQQTVNTTPGSLYILRLEGLVQYGNAALAASVDDGSTADSVINWNFLTSHNVKPGKLYTFERTYRAESSPATVSFEVTTDAYGTDTSVLLDNLSFKLAQSN